MSVNNQSFIIEDIAEFGGEDIGIGGTLLDEELSFLSPSIDREIEFDLGIGFGSFGFNGIADLTAGIVPFIEAGGNLINIDFAYPTEINTEYNLDQSSRNLILDTNFQVNDATLDGRGLDLFFNAGVDLLADINKIGLEELIAEANLGLFSPSAGPRDFLIEDINTQSTIFEFNLTDALRSLFGQQIDEQLEDGVSSLIEQDQESNDDNNDDNNDDDDDNLTSKEKIGEALQEGTSSDFGFLDKAIDIAIGAATQDFSNNNNDDQDQIDLGEVLAFINEQNPVTIIVETIKQLLPGLDITTNLIPSPISGQDEISNNSITNLPTLEADDRNDLLSVDLDLFGVITELLQKLPPGEPITSAIRGIAEVIDFDVNLGPLEGKFDLLSFGPFADLNIEQDFLIEPEDILATYEINVEGQEETLTEQGLVGETISLPIPEEINQEDNLNIEASYELLGEAGSSFSLVPTLGGGFEVIEGSVSAFGTSLAGVGPIFEGSIDTDLANFEIADFEFAFDEEEGINNVETFSHTIPFSDIPGVAPERESEGPSFANQTIIENEEGETVGSASLNLPSYTSSQKADYTLELTTAASDGANLNFAYIIDVSGSMSGTEIAEAKEAYVSLTDSLGEAANTSRFAVIPFNSSANTFGPLDATEAIEKIESLSAGGGTNFGPPVLEATEFFKGLSTGRNIAYFLSDGESSSLPTEQEIATLQEDADIRAFGIGNADRDSLEQIDSDGSVPILDDPADLTAEFETSGFNRDAIDEIEVSVDGNVIDTLDSSDLEDTSVGLSFSGTLTNLDTSGGQENEIKAEISFKEEENINDTTLTTSIGDGSENVTTTDQDGKDVTRLARKAIEGIAQAGEEVFGNLLDNNLTAEGDEATLNGGGGNNTYNIRPDAQDVAINGNPDGEDTVRYEETQAERGSPRKVGEVTEVDDNTDTLINVDFIEFSDQRLDISGEEIQETPPSLRISDISVAPNEDVATFTLELSHAIEEDVEVDYRTIDGSAVANLDYEATEDTALITAGEQRQDIDIDILDEIRVTPDRTFALEIFDSEGAVFEQNQDLLTATAEIENENPVATLSLQLDTPEIEITEEEDTAIVEFTVIREDNLTPETTVDYELTLINQEGEETAELTNPLEFEPDQSELDVSVDLVEELEDLDTIENTNFAIALDDPSRDATLTRDANAFGTVTIEEEEEEDDTTALSLNLDDSEVLISRDDNTAPVNFSIVRENNLDPTTRVDYEVTTFNQDGEETGQFSDQAEFETDQDEIPLSVDLVEDAGIGINENTFFSIALSNPSGEATLGSESFVFGNAIVEPSENDALLSVELDPSLLPFNDASFSILRDNNLKSETTVDYELTVLNQDGEETGQFTDQAAFETDEEQLDISVDLTEELDNLDTSEDQTLSIVLDNPSEDATLTQDFAFGTLTESALLSLELDNRQIDISDANNPSPLSFTIIRDNNLEPSTTVDYQLSIFDEEGNVIDDFTQEAEFQPDDREQTVSIDVTEELEELDPNQNTFFLLELTNPSDEATLSQDVSASGVISNNPLEITSEATTQILEQETEVLTVETTTSDNIRFFLIGGDDEEFFTLDEQTGELSFAEAPQFDQPESVSGDNIYEVEVGAVDEQGLFDSQLFEVEVEPNLPPESGQDQKQEGDQGTTPFTFTVNRPENITEQLLVSYEVIGVGENPADADDFGGTLPSGTINFIGEQDQKEITVEVTGDTQPEPDEQFTLNLTNSITGQPIDQDFATKTILNDDEQQPPEDPVDEPDDEEEPVDEPDDEEEPVDESDDEEEPVDEPDDEEEPVDEPDDEEEPTDEPDDEEEPTDEPDDEEDPVEVDLPDIPLAVNSESIFNESLYLAQNPDVANAVEEGSFNSGFEHFQEFGLGENRIPTTVLQNFDASGYLSENSDVDDAVGEDEIFESALDHYLNHGFQEGREGSNIPYDEAFYLNEYSDVLNAVENDDFGSGFEHFALFGLEENRASTQELLEFDADSYLGANPDVEQAVEEDEISSALEHWINFGAEEGRDLGIETTMV